MAQKGWSFDNGIFKSDSSKLSFMTAPPMATFGPLLIFLGSVVFVRVYLFAELEPRMDQAFSMQWIQSLRAADRFWPMELERAPFLQALIKDDGSWLHAFLRPIHAVSKLLLTLGAQLWFYLGSFLLGADSSGQIALSILAQAAAIGLIGAIGFSVQGGRPALAILAVLLATGSSFLHVFSPLGAHNVALLAVMSVAWSANRLLREAADPGGPRWGTVAAMFAAQAVALYTYYSVVFLVPPAIFLILSTAPDVIWRKRIRLVLAHGIATAITLLPLVGLVAWEFARGAEGQAQSFVYLAKWAWDPTQVSQSAFSSQSVTGWITIHAAVLSWPGVILGLAGLAWLARAGRCPLPLALVLVHFAVWVAMPGFRQFNRTSAYVIPFLALGMAAATVGAWRARHGLAKLAATALLIAHLAIDLPRLSAPEKVESWGGYYLTQGAFRALMADVRSALPAEAILMFQGYGFTHIWRALAFGDLWLRIATPMDTILARSTASSLSFPPTGVNRKKPLFVLMGNGAAPDISALSRIPCDDDGLPCGHAAVERVFSRPDPVAPGRDVILYRVRWARGEN